MIELLEDLKRLRDKALKVKDSGQTMNLYDWASINARNLDLLVSDLLTTLEKHGIR